MAPYHDCPNHGPELCYAGAGDGKHHCTNYDDRAPSPKPWGKISIVIRDPDRLTNPDVKVQ